MHFTVSSSTLLETLSRISGVLPDSRSAPLLETFLFDIAGNELSISASNMEIAMQTSLGIESSGGSITVVVPARILLAILEALPDQPIAFEVDEESFGIGLSAGNGTYKLRGEEGERFHEIPVPVNTRAASIPTDVMLAAIDRTLFAAAADEAWSVFSSMLFNFDQNGLTFVATDGHRLVRYRRVDIAVEEAHRFLVPRQALDLVRSSFDSTDGSITIERNERNVFFRADGLLLTCRRIDQQYPDYERVIPTDISCHLTVNRLELLGTLRRVMIFANKVTHQVRLKVSGSELTITGEDLDFANAARESLKVHSEGSEIEIGFHAPLLISMIENASTDDVLIKFSTPHRAATVLPGPQGDEEDILMLLMPAMLNTFAIS